MFRTLLSTLLIGLMLVAINTRPALASQTQDPVEKVRLKVAKMGVGDKAKVTVRMKNGSKVKGFITQAGDTDFTVRDKQTGNPATMLYSDVLKVEDNRGHSAARNLAIGIGIGAGAFLAVILIVFASLED